jgi:hypothetical protein
LEELDLVVVDDSIWVGGFAVCQNQATAGQTYNCDYCFVGDRLAAFAFVIMVR